MLASERRRHLSHVAVGQRRHPRAGEEAALSPRDEALSGQEAGGGREEEGAAALCGDGETHQVGDRPRTDRRRPESPYVGMLDRHPGRVTIRDDRRDPRTSGGGWAGGVGGEDGDARMWRGYPGTGGRTSTVSGNGSGRRRDWD